MTQTIRTPRFTSTTDRVGAVLRRDRRADGAFVYSVRTTGVYCRPSCPSRRARPENVEFHDTAADAAAAGFRPCRRCRPDLEPGRDDDVHRVAAACRLIERSPTRPALATLAAYAAMSPSHFHRTFTRIAGVTPAAYFDTVRQQRLRDHLRKQPSVTDAIFSAGYSSTSRFYESSPGPLGMTPSAYRRGGAGEILRYCHAATSLGGCLIAWSERGVCAILLGDGAQELEGELRRRFANASLTPAPDRHQALVQQVVEFIDDPAASPELPLDVRGTAFQRRVWDALSKIPAGQTASYGEIARRIGRPTAYRAVAGACSANPLAVAIPCHRVVASNGDLGGYRWGLDRKQALLARERSSAQPGHGPSARPAATD